MKIREARQAARLSQQELGARIGLDQPAISRMERGQRSVSVEQLVAIAAALDIPVAQLLPPALVTLPSAARAA